MLLESKPTINIEGLVGGYTGPGGKTVLPHRAVAKIDMRLVPDMTAAGTLALLKEHLAKHGFGDIEVNMSGGYDPTQTSPDTEAHSSANCDFLPQTRSGSCAVASISGFLVWIRFHFGTAQSFRLATLA